MLSLKQFSELNKEEQTKFVADLFEKAHTEDGDGQYKPKCKGMAAIVETSIANAMRYMFVYLDCNLLIKSEIDDFLRKYKKDSTDFMSEFCFARELFLETFVNIGGDKPFTAFLKNGLVVNGIGFNEQSAFPELNPNSISFIVKGHFDSEKDYIDSMQWTNV